MTIQHFNLSGSEAVDALAAELSKLRDSNHLAELKSQDPDTTFILGYETAIHDLRRAVGPDPMEVYVGTLAETPEGIVPVLQPITEAAVAEAADGKLD